MSKEKNATETFQILNNAYLVSIISFFTVLRWHGQFSSDSESLADERISGVNREERKRTKTLLASQLF